MTEEATEPQTEPQTEKPKAKASSKKGPVEKKLRSWGDYFRNLRNK